MSTRLRKAAQTQHDTPPTDDQTVRGTVSLQSRAGITPHAVTVLGLPAGHAHPPLGIALWRGGSCLRCVSAHLSVSATALPRIASPQAILDAHRRAGA